MQLHQFEEVGELKQINNRNTLPTDLVHGVAAIIGIHHWRLWRFTDLIVSFRHDEVVAALECTHNTIMEVMGQPEALLLEPLQVDSVAPNHLAMRLVSLTTSAILLYEGMTIQQIESMRRVPGEVKRYFETEHGEFELLSMIDLFLCTLTDYTSLAELLLTYENIDYPRCYIPWEPCVLVDLGPPADVRWN